MNLNPLDRIHRYRTRNQHMCLIFCDSCGILISCIPGLISDPPDYGFAICQKCMDLHNQEVLGKAKNRDLGLA